ncbi:MAG: F0F1 ATP synthase subunit epsilon [Bacteroidales bacterium]|nr:F0F1 ATP synthase subunit epsilon [Bacteroidales bacterium]
MSEKNLTIQILTPEGTLYEGTAQAVFLPGSLSPFEVLPGHAAIISALSAGQIRVVPVAGGEDGGERQFPIRSGVVKVRDNRITVCAEIV